MRFRWPHPLVLSVVLLVTGAASASVHCDPTAIRQAVESAKNSQKAKDYARLSKQKLDRSARKPLQNLFKEINIAIFGKSTFRIQEDFPGIPPMSTFNPETGVVSMSPQTLVSLNQKLSAPDNGIAFIMSHEIAHFVQNEFIEHNPKKMSPSGLKGSFPADDWESFNQLHAETDCIAVEIYRQSGFPLTDDISKTLQVIQDECKTQREESFCESANEIRQSAVQEYLRR